MAEVGVGEEEGGEEDTEDHAAEAEASLRTLPYQTILKLFKFVPRIFLLRQQWRLQ